jgi:hypothetical protein
MRFSTTGWWLAMMLVFAMRGKPHDHLAAPGAQRRDLSRIYKCLDA